MMNKIRHRSIVIPLTVAIALLGIPGLAFEDEVDLLAGACVVYADDTTGGAIAADISTASIDTIAPYIYSGKAIKPSPAVRIGAVLLKPGMDYFLSYSNNTLPGAATTTITGNPSAGYTGQKTVTFRIIIKAPTGLKAKMTGNNLRRITFSWTKVNGATGYKIYHARNASFTKEKKVKTIKGAGSVKYSIDHPYYKRNYYIKARAYKTIKGKNYYSDFTIAKKFTTKDLKWILVDLSKQKTYCKTGSKTKKKYTISSGKRATPTIRGTFYIYAKSSKHTMVGIDYRTGKEIYRQPNVRWIAYFKGGYAFHATYWHSNFGHTMSHGCVNMRTKDAKWLYKWAPKGTKVVVKK
ncbi:MAG: L,D-transpeptidase [Clostridiales Family XIII bacterium]|jgi:lipoprotein-anchoring transpeptidase ErfK/SrfK|nr:L,D-transpeptidase [Clostridiales Family XIII bacterium]